VGQEVIAMKIADNIGFGSFWEALNVDLRIIQRFANSEVTPGTSDLILRGMGEQIEVAKRRLDGIRMLSQAMAGVRRSAVVTKEVAEVRKAAQRRVMGEKDKE
jgi:hypothetical protein